MVETGICGCRSAGGARGAEPDGEPGVGGRGRRGGARARVHGHRLPHDARAALPAAVQDAARVVPLRIRQQRDRRYVAAS